MDQFLQIEYEQCLALVKHYDDRQNDLVKFASTLSAAVPSVLFAFHNLGQSVAVHFWRFAAFLSLTVALSLTIVLTAIIQNRLYFVYVARQVNAIRRRMVEVTGFSDNQMYIDPKFAAFSWRSTQSVLQLFVAIQAGLFLATSIFAILRDRLLIWPAAIIASIVAVGFVAMIVVSAARYLRSKGSLNADEGVHGTR